MTWRPAGKACGALKTPVCTCGGLARRSRDSRRHLSSAVTEGPRRRHRDLNRRVQWRSLGPDTDSTQCRNAPRQESVAGRRTYMVSAAAPATGASRSTPPKAPRVAIIGAGLTGLTTAYYLALKLPPQSQIVVYEASNRIGGWLRSERTPVDVNGVKTEVLFERGPRLLSAARMHSRNDRLVLFDLITSHGLLPSIPKPLSRYIWNDRDSRLIDLPATNALGALLREPVFWTTGVPAIVRYSLKWLLKSPNSFPQDDVSVGEWLLSVTGSRSLVDDIASAGIHGIWGGDIYRLSAASVLGWLFQRARHPGVRSGDEVISVSEREFVERFLAERPNLEYLWRRRGTPLLSFGRHGLEALPIAIADTLQATPNVDIRLGTPVQGLTCDSSWETVAVSDGKQKERFDKVISTLPSQHLARITGDKLPSLKDGHSVSIMAVNLWYPFRDLVPPGLGYLIPRSVPPERNPERALGVFLDSEVGVGSATGSSPQREPGTKLFVLLGGHYYDQPGAGTPPTEAEAIEQAKALLERQLNIPRSMPCYATARFNRECLPQHYVGHHRRMAAASKELEGAFKNRLAAIGGSYRSPGILGGLRSGYDMAHSITSGNFFDNGLQDLAHDKFMNPDITFIPPHWNSAGPVPSKG